MVWRSDIGEMRVLVTFAVEAEFAPWRRLRTFRKAKATSTRYGPVASPILETTIGTTRVSVLLTGIGREQCETTLNFNEGGVFSDEMPRLVISSGLAGALKESLSPADLFVPKKVRTLRDDANADSDPEQYERAVSLGAKPVENLITMERLVPTAEEKARIAFHGEAVDMESAFVMSHFAAAGVPVVTIRAISDGANEDLPIDFDRCLTPQGAIRPMRLMNQIVRRPGNLPNLVRFGRQSNLAAKRLVEFLDQFVEALNVVQERVVTV
jgi:adenosylhomocysteine nucleosidase